ncbi:hypothetical protein Chor_003527 [Crotalus horridus]
MLITFRYLYVNKKESGHDVVVLKHSSAVKVTVKDIARPTKPMVCFTYIELNPHKIMATLRAGQDCRDSSLSFFVETGLFAGKPALQAKFKYPKVPEKVNYVIDQILAVLPGIAYLGGFTHKVQKNSPKEISMVMALKRSSECIMVMKLPEDLLYNDRCTLPFSVPMDPKAQTSKISEIPKLLLASRNGQQFCYVLIIISGQTCGPFNDVEYHSNKRHMYNLYIRVYRKVFHSRCVCVVEGKKIISFSNQLITKGLPDNCFINVLGDCTCRKNLMVLMKYETEANNSLLIEIHTHDIVCTMKSRNGELIVEVNGTRLQDGVLPRKLQHLPLQFKKTVNEVDFSMPLVGLEKVTYKGDGAMFEVNTLIENSCGLCGWYGSEARKFRRPSGHLAKDEVSFVQSWVVPDACGGDCKLRHTTVRHENPILMGQENQQCATNLPVVRCAEGCSATSTTKTLASFHCVPAGTTLPTDLTVLAEKSEDLVDLVESHTSCSCEQERCVA